MNSALRPQSIPLPVRIWRLALIAVVLTVISGGYYELCLSRPVGIGPVAIAVDGSRYSAVWSDRPVHLLGLGDSITAGYGASAGRSYFRLLVNSSADDFADIHGAGLQQVLPKLTSENRALSGSTSLDLVEFTLPRVEPIPQDIFGIVVLTTGGNDVIHNYGQTAPQEGAMFGASLEEAEPWIERYVARLSRILNEIDSKFPGGCEVFIGNIYDPTDGSGDIEHAGLPSWPEGIEVLKRYNAAIAKICKSRRNAHLVDIRDEFLGHGIHCRKFWGKNYRSNDPHYWYYDNLEDPNDRGYDAIRRLFLNEIARVVPARLSQE